MKILSIQICAVLIVMFVIEEQHPGRLGGPLHSFGGGFAMYNRVASRPIPNHISHFHTSALDQHSGDLSNRVFDKIYIATTTTTTISPVELFSNLGWLKSVLRNGALVLSKGNYKLGLGLTIDDRVECSNAPLNAKGNCTLIEACPKIHHVLVSKDVYEQHFCVIKDEYAGVCCPNA